MKKVRAAHEGTSYFLGDLFIADEAVEVTEKQLEQIKKAQEAGSFAFEVLESSEHSGESAEDKGDIQEDAGEQEKVPELPKPLSKMTKPELQEFLLDQGEAFGEEDTVADLRKHVEELVKQ